MTEETNYMHDRFKQKLYGKSYEPKKVYTIPKKSMKRVAQEKLEKELRGDNDTELQRWFKTKIKYSTGHCSECNCKVEKNVYQYAVMTVAHLLAKNDNCCPSVKTHPQNFIILCPDCHNDFDRSTWEEKELMGCWQIVRDRLVMVWPDLAASEQRFFPESVLKFMEANNAFQ
jgi:5-methylcytosine-specific restriction endonuclease McrA